MSTKSRNPVLVVIEGVFANLLLGTLFVWSILRNPLLELFPAWNDGMLSVIFGIHNLFTCAGILLGGQLCRRFSSRKVFAIFALLVFVGLSGFAFLPVDRPTLSYAMAFVLFCLFAATGIGIGINVVQSTTIPWFPKNSGAISGALYMALGVSSVLLAALAQWLLPVIGVKNVMPVFGVIVLIAAGLILCDRQSMLMPESVGSSTDGDEGVSARAMLRMAAFWVLIIWNTSLRTAGLTLLDHAASMASAFGGAALVAMFIAPANGLGCIFVGTAMDKLGMRKIMKLDAALMILAGVILCVGTFFGILPMVSAGLLLGGFAYGGSSSSYAATIKNRFGSKYYTQNFAVSNLAMGCAALLESTSGTVLDASGSYFVVMLMVLALAVIAILAAFFARKAKI